MLTNEVASSERLLGRMSNKPRPSKSVPKITNPTPKENDDPSSLNVSPPTSGLRGRLARFAITRSDTDLQEFDEGDQATAVPVGTPLKTMFVRVQRSSIARVHLLTHQNEGEYQKIRYLILGEVADVLPDDVAQYDLFRWVDRDGREGIWPVNCAAPSRRTELAAIAKASGEWCRVFWRGFGSNGARVALAAPKGNVFGEPRWSHRSDDELVEAAFHERMIEDVDHPLVRQLLGLE